MPVLNAKINGAWVPLTFLTPPEVFIGNTAPVGNEVMWIDTTTTPPTTKAFVAGAWVTVGAIAPDEVWVGPNDPGNAAVELWYDSDAAAVSVPYGMPIYSTVAEMNASVWPPYTRAIVNGVIYRNVSQGVWGRETPLSGVIAGPGGNWSGAQQTLITLNITAEPIKRFLQCTWHCLCNSLTGGDLQLYLDGNYIYAWRPPAGQSMAEVSNHSIDLAAGAAHTLTCRYNPSGQSMTTFNDATFHQLNWVIMPVLA